MTVTSQVTNAGIAAITAASHMGVQLNITGAVFGATNISSDPVTLAALTAIPNVVYTLTDTSLITYSRLDSNNVLFRIRLGNNIGNFSIGSFGIMMGTTLVAVTSLDYIDNKKIAVGSDAGNIRFYEIIINVNNFANIANLTILVSNDASLPEVDTELALPPAASSSYPVYFVHNWSYHHKPALASRYNGGWYFYPCFEDFFPGIFPVDIVQGDAVYFDANTWRFQKAVANDINRAPIAICGPLFKLFNVGDIYEAPDNRFTPGQQYYIDPLNPGKLTTTPNWSHVGYAILGNTLVLNNFLDVNKVVGKNLSIVGEGATGAAFFHIVKDGSFNQKNWLQQALTNDYLFWATSDDSTAGNIYGHITRTGYNVSSISFNATNGGNLNVNSTSAGLYFPTSNVIIQDNRVNLSTTRSGLELNDVNVTIVSANFSGTISNNTLDFGNSSGYHLNMNASGISFNGNNSGNFLILNDSGIYVNAPATTVAGGSLTVANGQVLALINSLGQNLPYPSPAVLGAEFFSFGDGQNLISKLPHGLQFCTGSGLTVTGKRDYIAFPAAFPTALIAVIVCEGDVTNWFSTITDPSPVVFGVERYGLAGFLVSSVRVANNGSTASVRYEGGMHYNYIAIGF